MITLTLILTLRPHVAILVNEDKQQSAMSEVDLKSKVDCFLPKSPQLSRFGYKSSTWSRSGATFVPNWVELAH